MGFRFQRRISLGNGVGLNLSKSGIGTSVRGKHGSIGSRGFSIRTGIPGLTFRQGWGKGGQGALVFLFATALVAVAWVAIVVLVRLSAILLVLAGQCINWCVLTAKDYLEYRKTGRQMTAPLIDHQSSVDELSDPQSEKTLAEIMDESSRSAQLHATGHSHVRD